MAGNVHIVASSLADHDFALAVAAYVAVGMNMNLDISALAGHTAGTIAAIAG